ncbi:UBX domain-containing protein 4 [Tribolium castaneum]|uniref:UBX domain-containing protein 4 n=1 Tax=Tribolium castaneum TaxID=7070 RepID=D6WRD2_TRICA|nr:PREDICTED: UBX domain-containing protein 4 [Tribolium castaneum]EFA06551.2 UBX domain-containing protein 4-like Protein [Tribolium castaneum]|eukprot:XP_972760.1 PREDICTED: UBX domain-containing protein 4 [Tribolium castaneum]
MNWFKGEIAQAIVTSKAKQAIFVVYVYGKDDKSAQITELIDKEEIVKILGSDSFVAIKIEADSVPYQQFSQIYKQVPTPSVYFIGKQGVPIEIVTEVNDVKTFQEKLNSILQKGGLSPIASQSQDFITKEQAQNVVCENDVCTMKKDETPSTSQQAVAGKEDLTVEEKVERAKQLVELKREEKRKEEFEKEREKELERRKMGQNVQQLKRWQEDQELKQVLEEREREKRESQAARERVLAQIAQDKAERAAKFSPTATVQPQAHSSQSQSSPRPVNTNTARLQFRMPDGSTATNDFSSSDTLASVHAHIKANLHLPFSNYTLSTTFPRREFTEAENSQTLLQLGLVPTAVILILPVNRGVVATNTEGGFTGFLWTLITPILTLLGYLKTFVFGSAPAPSTSNDNKRAAEASSSDHRGQPKVRRGGETTVIRRQGNIHRLSNKNDSDDENNTWNGNSTQQM